MNVAPVDTYMTRRQAILITESLPEPLSKIFRTTGYARSAALRNQISHPLRNNLHSLSEQIARTAGPSHESATALFLCPVCRTAIRPHHSAAHTIRPAASSCRNRYQAASSCGNHHQAASFCRSRSGQPDPAALPFIRNHNARWFSDTAARRGYSPCRSDT